MLLDLTMPGMDGLTALPHIREASPESEVVVLTASGTDENLLEAIRAGAAGYLLKSEPPERIALFLRGVAHGEAALSGSIARRLLDRVREGGRRGGVPDAVARAVAREVEVLLLLDEHLGTDEIAARLYISEHTVRSHVKSLLRKLGVSSRREALERLAVGPRARACESPTARDAVRPSGDAGSVRPILRCTQVPCRSWRLNRGPRRPGSHPGRLQWAGRSSLRVEAVERRLDEAGSVSRL